MNTSLNAAEKWLNEMGIKTIARPTCLMVNRNDMVNTIDGETPEISYGLMLKELRVALNTTKIFWGGKDDDYLYLESF